MTRRTSTTVLALALMVALGAALHACGNGGGDKRQRERCDVCDPTQIDPECVKQCLPFCSPSESAAECADRCNVECDRCKAELECQACSADCTGTIGRCAPTNEVITCEDGDFGGGPGATPQPTATSPAPTSS